MPADPSGEGRIGATGRMMWLKARLQRITIMPITGPDSCIPTGNEGTGAIAARLRLVRAVHGCVRRHES